MKLFNPFLVALTVFVFIFPANAQRRKRATQPQPTPTEQITPSGNGRRVTREAAKTPRVRCTVPLVDSPGLRGLKLDLSYGRFDVNFFGDLYFDISETNPSDRSVSNPYHFLTAYALYPRQIRRKSVIESLTPEQKAAAVEYMRRMHPEKLRQIEEEAKKAEEEQRNAPEQEIIEPKDLIKKMFVQFYGRENPTIYNYQILYRDDFAFENEEEIEQLFAEKLKIPVGAWVPIPDPDYNMKVLRSLFGVLDLRFTPPENIILRQADCNGWRAVFVTSSNTTGLALSVSNSFVSDNMEQLVAQDQKAVNEEQKQRTRRIFKQP